MYTSNILLRHKSSYLLDCICKTAVVSYYAEVSYWREGVNLYETTREMLIASRGQFRKIADETGLDYFWLSSVAQGRIEDPGVRKMQRLYDYLKGKEGKASA